MKIVKAYRYKLEPKAAALEAIRQFGGAKRYIYNRLLAERDAAWKALGPDPTKETKKAFNREWSYVGMARKITAWRAELEWLSACPVHALQNAAKDLDVAYKNWWAGRGRRPVFKKKGKTSDSWRESDPACIAVNGQAVKLPKIGWVRARISRPFQGTLKSATARQESDGWYISLISEEDVADSKPNGGPSIGLDKGLVHSFADSDGIFHELPTMAEREERHIRRLQQAVSRKCVGSKNRTKAQAKLNRALMHIRRRVDDARHKLTTNLAKEHEIVVHEDLNVQNMTASASGSVEEPGKNVSAKSALNRRIMAQGWGETARQLAYKCVWYGSRDVKVPPQGTSQECSECEYVDPENRESQAVFRCKACGHTENADINAAKAIKRRGLKILAAGHAASACREDVRRRQGHAASMKQEPTRGAQRCAV